MYDWLGTHRLAHIPLLNWVIALMVALGGYVVARALLRLLARRLKALAKRHDSSFIHALAAAPARTSATLIFLLFVLLGAQVLGLPDDVHVWLGRGAFVVAGLQVGLWMNIVIMTWTLDRTRADAEDRTNPIVMTMLGWFARIMVWATLLLAVLGNMGVNITALVASLGIGGVAIALALQNILGDLFASLAIGLDKPFEIGEFIAFDDKLGTVTHVGVKTTRIRSLNGGEISIGNANLLGKTVLNYTRMQTRRIVFKFGIAIDTPQDKVQQVIAAIREILAATGNIVPDRAHLLGFGESSLEFEVVYIVQDPSYNIYMDIQQAINLELMNRLERLDVKLALPVRTVRVPEPVLSRQIAADEPAEE